MRFTKPYLIETSHSETGLDIEYAIMLASEGQEKITKIWFPGYTERKEALPEALPRTKHLAYTRREEALRDGLKA